MSLIDLAQSLAHFSPGSVVSMPSPQNAPAQPGSSKGLPVSNFTSLSFRGSHSKHAQGAGLVLQAQDAVSYPLQMAGQSHADVLNIPVEERQSGVEEELRTYFLPGLVPTVSTCIPPSLPKSWSNHRHIYSDEMPA